MEDLVLTHQSVAVDGLQPPFHDIDDTDGAGSSSGAEPTSIDNFRKSAQIFLGIYRQEVEQRDTEISKLKAELTRVREVLKALKEKQSAAEIADNHAVILAQPQGAVNVQTGTREQLDDDERTVHTLHDTEVHSPPSPPPSRFLADLTRDEANDVDKKVQDIWDSCFQIVKRTMEQDLGDDILTEWNVMYWLDLEERIPNITAIPIEPSNNPSAKRTRTMLVMALLAKSMKEHILSPTYLFEDEDELRRMLATMNDTERKTHLRRTLLALCEEGGHKNIIKAARVKEAVEEAAEPLQNLLSSDILLQLKADLEQVLTEAANAWESLQRCESHYEVTTTVARTGWDWRSVHFLPGGDDMELATVASEAFETDEAVMVLFPRVCAIDRSKKPWFTPAFPGIVIQKSQLQVPTAESLSVVLNTNGSPEKELEAVESPPAVTITTVDSTEKGVVADQAVDDSSENEVLKDQSAGEKVTATRALGIPEIEVAANKAGTQRLITEQAADMDLTTGEVPDYLGEDVPANESTVATDEPSRADQAASITGEIMEEQKDVSVSGEGAAARESDAGTDDDEEEDGDDDADDDDDVDDDMEESESMSGSGTEDGDDADTGSETGNEDQELSPLTAKEGHKGHAQSAEKGDDQPEGPHPSEAKVEIESEQSK
ncbi:hypothetical protein A1O1_06614 [Capronia coronata CBS 617.96]|uniref:Uncharacterized protein n=1 Tax=Capronia coronata CBS 617.96 TaxID=1182541 RepID=W9YVD4_9EURO|nr:uncharacterized protein A1O1_06614 [Capronia coronata CBS 617.96]EXJ86244.1 hypothetical protein A1O1_06614 [Capronia coronata CBS 617.96]